MSKFLAVDTSAGYLTVAVYNEGKETVSFVADCAMNHSVILTDEIDKALDKAGITAAECDFFAAVTGPGSFTGIRIGLSCVKGYAAALNKKAVGVTAFDLLSYNINSGCDYLTAIDAAHGNYYVCGYDFNGGRTLEPCCLSAEEIISLGKPVYGTGEAALPLYTKLDPAKCLVPAAIKAEERGGSPTALYVKKPQAEEERERRVNGV
ncbi:MAG: tRNA (adenosine(37)-N6)-threonylcarbamoyltransferase complex dimerization subunit type 1 TsaB [Roseburia sp.]|nr:tRNA (adenosine(37)-N6)-threonylcarbamoyltransferase complex dimerization subunit type 1 TsaB [Roseburia sp.]